MLRFAELLVRTPLHPVTDTDRESTEPREAAEYIAALAHELAALAGAQRLDVLRYILEMARDEARMAMHAPARPPDEA